jgi:PAS domain S-box-containing protein
MAISAARDITERKEAGEALRKVSEEQAILLDNIDTLIWYLTDLENNGAVNRALAEFFGMQKSDIAYKNIYDILGKEEARVCIAGNREVFESKRQVCTEELVKNGRGELRLLSIFKTPKLDKDGNVEYVVCAAEDITRRLCGIQRRSGDRLPRTQSTIL